MSKKYRNFHFAAYKLNTSFYVRSVGDFRLTQNAREHEKKADFPEIFWCVDGCGSFFYEGRYYFLHPGQVWYYPAGSRHRVSCYGELFHYRWIAWDGADASVLFDGLNLKPGINQGGECPHALFNKLTLNIEKNTVDAQKENLAIGFEILLSAAFARPRDTNRTEKIKQVKNIIDENFSDPALNVQRIADLVQINRSVISRMFSCEYKITIVEYIASLRLQKALRMIRQTDIPLKDIAGKCGYSCHNYFTKVIRHHTGSTPRELRSM